MAAAERQRDGHERTGWLLASGAPDALRADPARVPREIRTWVRSWRGRPEGTALVCGPVGTGKSMAVQWAMAELWARGRWADEHHALDWRPLGSALRIRAVDLQRAVYDGKADRRATWEAVSFLAIEDVRVLPESAWRLADELHALVDLRCDHSRATVLTTNVTPEAFEAAYEPLFSRLVGAKPGLVKVLGRDQRRATQ